jgi:GTP pyrophosphokinase
MRLVKTSRARSKIRAHIDRRERERSIEVGRRLCDKELRRWGLNLKKSIAAGEFDEIASHFGVSKGDDVLAGVGYGKIAPKQVIARLLPPDKLEEEAPGPKRGIIPETVRRALGWDDEPVVNVEGMDDILVSRARCCDPIPGEPIVGYVTRGKGVSVHAVSCPNVLNLLFDPERRIDVAWDKNGDTAPYTVRLRINVADRRGILADVSSRIAGINTNIRDVEATVDEGQRGSIRMTVEITDVKHLDRVVKSLKSVEGVLAVERARR